MRKRNRFFTYIFLSTVLFSSCQQDQALRLSGKDQVKANIYGQIGEMTRTANNDWEQDDEIGVYARNEKMQFSNVSYSYEEVTHNFRESSLDMIFFRYDHVGYDFTAYYPHVDNSKIHDGIIDVNSTSRGEGVSFNNDIMFANQVSADNHSPNVNLHFEHKMAQIVLDLYPEQNAHGETIDKLYNHLSQRRKTISGFKFEGTFNLKTGDVRVKPEAVPKNNLPLVGVSVEKKTNYCQMIFYVIPQEISNFRFSAQLGDNFEQKEVLINAPTTDHGITAFEGGHSYTCKVVANFTYGQSRLDTPSDIGERFFLIETEDWHNAGREYTHS